MSKENNQAGSVPLATTEVRWFLPGSVDEHRALRQWFETCAPFEKVPELSAPEWKGRLNDAPDIYLIVPGAADMGIKLREDQFQVKGRVAQLGEQVFPGGHVGFVEQWVKWSYADVPDAYEKLFTGAGKQGLQTASVSKTRALRKVQVETLSGKLLEVDDDEMTTRGVSAELTQLTLEGRDYCSVAFEAYPDDSAMPAAFSRVVSGFVSSLASTVLTAGNSLSYPAWLRDVMR